MNSNASGYSRLSIIVHWLTAIVIVALFLTHEGDRGSSALAFHVGGGAILGLFLLWRVARRVKRGMTTKPQQAAILNLASQAVIWGFLIAIVVAVLSGYVLPWSRGMAIDVFGFFQIPSPIASNHFLHEVSESLHGVSGTIVVPLLILHVLGAIKHAVIDKDGIMQRMTKSISDGR